MAEPLVVGLVATPQAWRQGLEFFVADHVGALRLVSLHEPSDAFNNVDVVVIDDTLSFLTPAQVVALRDQGVRIVGIYDPDARRGRGHASLDLLGTDVALPLTATPDEIVDAVATLAPNRTRREATRPPHPPAPSPESKRGLLIAVAGSSDSPGRTEIAIALSDRIARRGHPMLLVDLDLQHPSIVRRLGYHESPGLREALAATGAGTPLHWALAVRNPLASGQVRFDAIAGLVGAITPAEHRDLRHLLIASLTDWPYVVADIGPRGGDQPGSPDLLTAADVIVAACNGTRSGVLRFIDWVPTVLDQLDTTPLVISVNRAPRNGFHRTEIRDQLRSQLPAGLVHDVTFLPHDPAVFHADWSAAAVSSGKFLDSVDRLVEQLCPRRAPEPRRLEGARA